MSHLNRRTDSITLADILAVEDDPEILSFRCPDTGWLAWPTVRHVFLCYLINELSYPWPGPIRPVPNMWQHRKAVPALARCIVHNRLRRSGGVTQRPVMIFASTGTLVPWEGGMLNRVSDHFAFATPGGASCFEDVLPPRYEIPRARANPDVLYTLPALAKRYLVSALQARGGFDSVARDLTASLVRQARRLFELAVSPERQAITQAFIARGLRRYPHERSRYRSLFEQARPRILLVTAGTHGSLAAAIQVAHDMGIAVAEYQHGVAGSGQPEYNFAPVLLGSEEYRRTLPDYFLSFGCWWTARFNAPVQRVAIGNPHRSESLPRLCGPGASNGTILVVAKLGDVARFVSLALDVHRYAGGRLEVVIRPDPRDLASVLERHRDRHIGAVRIDADADFYLSLAQAEVVVGGPSTTLFDAIGIARRVFIWNEVGGAFKYPEPMFERFNTAEDLVAKLNAAPDVSLDRPPSEEIWAPDWRSRYARFIAPFLS